MSSLPKSGSLSGRVAQKGRSSGSHIPEQWLILLRIVQFPRKREPASRGYEGRLPTRGLPGPQMPAQRAGAARLGQITRVVAAG